MNHLNQRARLAITASLFAAYLIVFSGVALFHAYAENEVTEVHTCAVGLWVQGSDTGLASFAVPVPVLPFCLLCPMLRLSVPARPSAHQVVPRGPPPFA